MIAPVQHVGRATTPSVTPDAAKLKATAQQFEAVFLREMIGSMRKAKLADDPFASAATDQFRELADARTADQMAMMGQFGIAKLIEAQLAARKDTK